MRLLAPGRWATVWRYALPPGEEPLTLAVLRLRDMVSGATHPLVAVGTCLPLGEVRRRQAAGLLVTADHSGRLVCLLGEQAVSKRAWCAHIGAVS